MINIE